MPAPNITELHLPINEYVNQTTTKRSIVLHHTAGGHRPDAVINWWNNDRNSQGQRSRVATSYVIGGKSTTTGDTTYNGRIYRAFPDTKFAYHLGLTNVIANRETLEKQAIGIEICNYGPLIFEVGRGYINYVNQVVPDNQVVQLANDFRGFRFYHKYTTAQIDSLLQLVRHVANIHEINLQTGLKNLIDSNSTNPAIAFGYDNGALAGAGGIWTHTNFRTDKTDCSPQQGLIDLIRAL
jgi:N-acetyl-anhydromuramyl-L-alanine amidase AmpD